VHDNAKLQTVFSVEPEKKTGGRRIFLNDWGEAFLVTFENDAHDHEVTYFVTTNEVQWLFETGRVFIEPDEIYSEWEKKMDKGD
jgi:hypothetical protein